MPSPEIQLPDEFASTMQQLVAEAEKTIPTPARSQSSNGGGEPTGDRSETNALHERIAHLESLVTNGFKKVEAAVPANGDDFGSQLQRLDAHMLALRNTESVNQRLFNSLHQELKSYRDDFLRESLQKPFIRDLVVLFDDLSGLSAQMESTAGSETRANAASQWRENLQNAIHSLTEIMHRMEVSEIEPKEMVDRAFHRVVSYEPADFAEDDGRIVMRVKRGFVWRDQVLRPEEVVAKRFS